MSDTLILLAIIITAGIIQGIAGFGFGLFAMGLLVLIMPVPSAVVIVAIVTMSSIIMNLWTVRHSIRWREAWPIMLTALPATAGGVFLLGYLPQEQLRLGVAVMILLGCAVALWNPDRSRLQRAFPWAHLSGLIGGVFGGALNMGGPPVVLYSLLRGWDKAEAKGVMSAYFFATGILRIALHVASGRATPELIRQGLILLIPGFLASYLGVCVFRRISNRTFRYAVTTLLVVLAVRVIVPVIIAG